MGVGRGQARSLQLPAQFNRLALRLGTHVDLLGGEGPDAHAGGVGLHHSVHVPDVLRGDAQTRAHAAHRAVGGSHKRVGPCKTEDWGCPPPCRPGPRPSPRRGHQGQGSEGLSWAVACTGTGCWAAWLTQESGVRGGKGCSQQTEAAWLSDNEADWACVEGTGRAQACWAPWSRSWPLLLRTPSSLAQPFPS